MLAGTLTLEAGLAIEYVKHRAPLYLEKAVTWLEDTAEELDRKYGKAYPCTRDIVCMKEGTRHKHNCPMSSVEWNCTCKWCESGVKFTSIPHSKDCTGVL